MTLKDSMVITADDLTGANDTALQFFKQGAKVKIVIDCLSDFDKSANCDVWAISTESRNTDKETAATRVLKVSEILKEALSTNNFYKKIDSTMRGNAGIEIAALLENLQKDAAIIVPAYAEEGRTTIGAYQLLNGIPIERTQCALDPKSPIYDSYIPNILKKDVQNEFDDLIDFVGFDIVAKGAGPITLKINELIQKNKKMIIVDAMSDTDLEQIALALDKINYDILPCASAGLAHAMSKITHPEADIDDNKDEIKGLFKSPRLIISGSATKLTKNQIEKLKEEKDIFSIDLTIDNVIDGIEDDTVKQIVQKLNEGKDVIVHASNISDEMEQEELSAKLIDAGIAKTEFSSKITSFLAELVFRVGNCDFILIMIGGETSYKCAHKIGSSCLDIIDAIMPAVPLCVDKNDKIIVTKSGNFGTNSTLIDILNYFDNNQ